MPPKWQELFMELLLDPDRSQSERAQAVAAEHEKRKIGDDVRQCREKDGGGQLGRTQPGRYASRQSFSETAHQNLSRPRYERDLLTKRTALPFRKAGGVLKKSKKISRRLAVDPNTL